MNPFRSILPVVALVAGLAGCSTPATPGAPSSTGQNTATVEPPPSTPGTESSGVETPRSGDYGVAISIPQLPVGGGAEDETVENQCVNVSWLRPGNLPDGGVRVTGIRITPSDAFSMGGGCGGQPACASFTFHANGDSCSVAVKALGTTGSAKLVVEGTATCPSGREELCRELRTGSNREPIPLTQPDEITRPESPVTETPPSSPETSPSPTG
ncbi:hypothetical protein DMA12_06445 [Amycolatopsis balhimycina DSM 5908]|uniref:Uncharacterized protein n=1 Tax=Amycolatopsis balhimycina DSM 5908 TaxID=1081091 RepID=A0A428X077_AMYBA|nr:hypothetical protein [Amycolatopsis balhimycina]RSM48753.1 hypothetical protein DMA12_06445 [Amycolatopsis balhimycina DSM 5908]